MKNVIVKIVARDPQSNTDVTIRLSAAWADASAVVLDGQEWIPVLTGWSPRSVKLFGQGELQTVEISHGDLTFILTNDMANTDWSNLIFDGRPCQIWTGNRGDDWPDYQLQFSGSCGAVSREGLSCTVSLAGPESVIAKDLLTASYAGTGGAEGPVEMKGTLKPFLAGKCQNVGPVLIDPIYWIYQVHAGPVASIDMVYERAFPVNTNPPTIVASYAALVALALVPGQWAACPSAGMFRLGGQPSGLITADVSGSLLTLGDIVSQMIETAGGSAHSSLDDFASSWSYYSTVQSSVGDVVRSALQQAGGYLFPDSAGVFRAGHYFDDDRPIVALNDDRSTFPLVQAVRQEASAPPAYRVKIGYDRCWQVHGAGDISPLLLEDTVARDAANDALNTANQVSDQLVAVDDRVTTVEDTVVQVTQDLETAEQAIGQAAADVAAAQNQIAELFDAAGDINTAVGTATTAANNAEAAKTLAQNAANQSQQNVLRAASHATGNIIAKGTFGDGSAGEWFGNASVVTPTVAPPSGAAKVLRATDRDNLEGSFREGNWTGRIINVDFTARALGAYQAGLGVHIVHADGSLNFIGYDWAQPGAGWQHITGDIQLPSSPPIVKLIPWLHVAGPWNDPQNIAEFDALRIEDVTEQRRAAQSASASLTSANTAAAKANDASAQAAAAESAKLSAQTSAGQASAYRDQSATSASTADSAKNTATSQANLAASLRDQASGYANSASTNASLANASKDAAGVSASSASGSANTASIQASNALASANSANNSAVVATERAAAAQQSSIVAASIALGTFNPNPSFSAYSNTSGVPDNWNDWSNGQGQSWRVTGESGLGYAMAQNNGVGQNVGLYANFVTSIKANDYVVIEGRVRLESGSLWGAGVLLQFFDPSQNLLAVESINFVYDADATGNVGGAGTAGKTYAFSKLVRAPNANVALSRLYQMTAWDGFDGGRPAKTLSWYRAAVRPATSAEIAAKQALDQVGSLSATVTTQAGAIASLQGKTSAYWQVEAVAGGRAQLRVYADSNGGGGVDIVGDLRVSGDLVVDGSINTQKLGTNSITTSGYFNVPSGGTLSSYSTGVWTDMETGSFAGGGGGGGGSGGGGGGTDIP